MSRFARRTDSNQTAIVEALRACGWLVSVNSDAGMGRPDLTICRPGEPSSVRLVEVKRPDGKRGGRSRGALTKAQQEHVEQGWPVIVVKSVDEAVALMYAETRGQRHEC